MWSGLPSEPPPQVTEPGSALNLAIRSSSVLIEVGRHHQQWVLAGQPGQRRHLVERGRRLVGEDRPDHAQAGDQQAGPAAPLLGHELGQADRAAGTGMFIHLHADQAFALQALSCVARCD